MFKKIINLITAKRVFVFAWIVVLVLSLSWNIYGLYQKELAKAEARGVIKVFNTALKTGQVGLDTDQGTIILIIKE